MVASDGEEERVSSVLVPRVGVYSNPSAGVIWVWASVSAKRRSHSHLPATALPAELCTGPTPSPYYRSRRSRLLQHGTLEQPGRQELRRQSGSAGHRKVGS